MLELETILTLEGKAVWRTVRKITIANRMMGQSFDKRQKDILVNWKMLHDTLLLQSSIGWVY